MEKQQNTKNVINTILHIILIVITVIAATLEIMLILGGQLSKIILAIPNYDNSDFDNSDYDDGGFKYGDYQKTIDLLTPNDDWNDDGTLKK